MSAGETWQVAGESGLQVAVDLQVSDLSGNASYQVVDVRR